MGEYADYNGQRIKIGTCEDMYYLRADQAHLVKAKSPGTTDPIQHCKGLRFRFPFPDEDKIEPGAFPDYQRAFPVKDAKLPEDMDHSFLQFTRNYPRSGGIVLSTPCPESPEGKTLGQRFQYNSYGGKVLIRQQRVWEGKLVLVCECGSCAAPYRLPNLSDAQPIIDSLLNETGVFYEDMARRIEQGYNNPPDWVSKTHEPASV